MNKYLEVTVINNLVQEENKNPNFLEKILTKFFSPAKFDDQKKVKYWLLEFAYNDWNYKYEIQREIGLDENKNPILKLPNEKNKLGYWMDEDVDYDYFKKHLKTEDLSKEKFSTLWNN